MQFMNKSEEINLEEVREFREELKRDRRKLFRTLYTLPWILMMIGLLIIGYYWGKQEREAGRREIQLLANSNGFGKWELEEDKIVFKFNNKSNRPNELIDLINLESSELLRLKSFRKNETNLETTIIHKEIYITNFIAQTNVLQLVMTNYEFKTIIITNYISDLITNSYRYGYKDKVIGDKAGIDIEKLIRERTYIRVRDIFNEYEIETGKKFEGLEARLLIGIREEIRGSFEIFEIYNRATK